MRTGSEQRSSSRAVQRCRAITIPGILALLLAHPGAAQGALGGSREEIARDQEALGGTRTTVTSGQGYEVHEMITADGTTVRQYVEPSGRVFAVTWSGRFRPNLKVLLGSHYAAYEAAARAPHTGHHVLSVSTGDLTLTLVQLPRGWSGRAHLTSLVPSWVDVEQLR